MLGDFVFVGGISQGKAPIAQSLDFGSLGDVVQGWLSSSNSTYLGEAWVVGKPIGEMILREDGEVGALGCRRGDEGGCFEEVGFGVEGLIGQLA